MPKRRYSGFYDTDLQTLLEELRIDTIILAGLHTDICIRHTAADAFYHGYRIILPTDGVEAFTEEDQLSGLDYLKQVYGAELLDTSGLLERLEDATV